jgi:hypothetical protein
MKGSFWWRRILRLLNILKGIAQVQLGTGDSILFWKDLWNGRVLRISFPELISFAKDKKTIVAYMIAFGDLLDAFILPLSERAFDQFCKVVVIIQSMQLNGDKDVWSYIWGNAHYSSQKAYKHLLGTQAVHPAFAWTWKSSCQIKHKVFFWLLL